MIQELIGKKLGMTHTYTQDGTWVPVTRLILGPCIVTQVKTDEADGYQAVQLSYGAKRHLSQPMAHHLTKSKRTTMPWFIAETRVQSDDLHVGDTIQVSDVFQEGDTVNVAGWTKGRGFTGVVKRWGFKGGPKTHGQSDRHRRPGSIGQGTDPGRVYPGKKMAGRHGQDRKTIANLAVVRVDQDHGELWVKGAVPGHPNSRVVVTVKNRRQKEQHETISH